MSSEQGVKIGYSLTDLKNQVMGKVICSNEIVRALVMDCADFLTATPNTSQTLILNEPDRLIRTQLMPYKSVTTATDKDKPYITTAWVNFKKDGKYFKTGRVYFYIIVPNSLEKTDLGIRYDYIVAKLMDLFNGETGSSIGKFEFEECSDMFVDSNTMGAWVSFSIMDFDGRLGV